MMWDLVDGFVGVSWTILWELRGHLWELRGHFFCPCYSHKKAMIYCMNVPTVQSSHMQI